MSSLGSPSPFFLAGKKAYEVERSLRFNDDDNAYLNRTPSSASNKTTFTLSVWVKRASNLDEFQRIFEAGANTSNRTYFTFDGDDKLEINHRDGGSEAVNLTTTAQFRDVSAWYHIVLAIDTTQSTSSDRIKIYVNGTQQTAFDTSTYPSSSKELDINSTAVHYIGRTTNNTSKFDGYMAEFNFIDGSQLTPSSFGATDVLTGQWNPKKYTGSYGTNGFYLNFSDNSGTTATTLGKDSSGNGNNFTPNNFSVAAGAGNDSLEDTPTNNFCTLNAIALGQGNEQRATISNGNLDFTESSSSNRTAVSTFGLKTGKWYFEFLSTNTGTFSIGWHDMQNNQGSFYRNNGSYSSSFGGGGASGYASWTTNDIVGVAIDFDSGKIWYAKNNTWQSGDPATGNSPTNTFTTGLTLHTEAFTDNSSGTKSGSFNYGQRPFTYTPPTGYKSICSKNLPDPTIKLPNQHFNTILYTGNDSNDRDITGVGFQPDWLWIKNRQQADWHMLQDAVRGANKVLFSNRTEAEDTDNTNGHVNSFLPDGFNITAGDSGNVNENNENYVAWNWNAGDTDGKTYTVKVVSDSGNKYRFDDFGTSAVTLDLAEGGTYIFDQSDSSNATHPLRFYTAADKTGGEYTTGVTTAGTPGQAGAYTQIVVAASAPTLYYQCSAHANMGGQVNTNSTLGSSNFDGAIQSTVKTNATAGFSITTYTGTGSSTTVGHGLAVKPDIIIIKRRDAGDNWMFYHKAVNAGVDPEDYYLELNSNGTQVNSTAMLNDTAPTSTSVTIGSDNSVNGSSATYVMYCFSEVAGFSKFGSYQANGSSDGAFVFTGHRPAWILIKNTSLGQPWVLMDNKINPHNLADTRLSPSSSATEYTGGDNYIDILSNGFKVRSGSSTDINYSTSYPNHIYLAFAESPFKNARAR